MSESLWMYAVHGQNPEIFNILEENKIELPKYEEEKEEEEDNDDDDDDDKDAEKVVTFEDCFFEAIKCYHNDVASFIALNILQTDKTNSSKYISNYLKYRNFSFNREFVVDESSLFSLCKYNHYNILKLLLKSNTVNVNRIEIFFIVLF